MATKAKYKGNVESGNRLLFLDKYS